METTSIAGKESYLTEEGEEEGQKWLYATISQLATTTPCRQAAGAAAAANIYGRSFVIGGGFTYSQTSARHTQDKRARARMRMEEAQYCRGARYVRKSRIAARAAVHEEERGMRVLLDITYSSS